MVEFDARVLGFAAAGVAAYAAVRALILGYRPARYFLLAWAALLAFIAFGALRNFTLVPTNFVTLYGLHIGFALDVLLLSFANGANDNFKGVATLYGSGTAGYRRALMTVCAVGMGGTALAGFSTAREYFAPFLLSFLFMGVAVGVIQLARYAAAETTPPAGRARAMGKVVLGSTVGAIAGPLLVGPFGGLAAAIGVPPLSGPWLAAFLFYAAALANTWFLLRPEPKELARQLAVSLPGAETGGVGTRSLAQLIRAPPPGSPGQRQGSVQSSMTYASNPRFPWRVVSARLQ